MYIFQFCTAICEQMHLKKNNYLGDNEICTDIAPIYEVMSAVVAADSKNVMESTRTKRKSNPGLRLWLPSSLISTYFVLNIA